MARKRMIDPEFFLNEKLAGIKAHSRLLYIGLWGIADDNHATLPNRPDWIKAQIFPYESIDIKMHLKELEKIGDIILFEHDNQEYWFIPSFFDYQKVEHPSKPKYPKYDNSHRVLTESSPNPRSQYNVIQSNVSKSNGHANPRIFTKPTPQEVTDYAKSIGFPLKGEEFVDYYEARGWKYKGNISMKDWCSAVRTWKKNADPNVIVNKEPSKRLIEAEKMLPKQDPELERQRQALLDKAFKVDK